MIKTTVTYGLPPWSLASVATATPDKYECDFNNITYTSLSKQFSTTENLTENLTHWGRVTHICFSIITIIGSDNGLSPGRRQAIIWTSAGILLIWTLGTNFGEIWSEIHAFSLKKMHLKMSSAKWRPFCLGLNVLTDIAWVPLSQSPLPLHKHGCT